MKTSFEIEDDNELITSTNGYEQDDKADKYWIFDINGEESMIGADDLELQEGDLVELNLEGINKFQ